MSWAKTHWPLLWIAVAILLTRYRLEIVSYFFYRVSAILFSAHCFWEASVDYDPKRFTWWIGVVLGILMTAACLCLFLRGC